MIKKYYIQAFLLFFIACFLGQSSIALPQKPAADDISSLFAEDAQEESPTEKASQPGGVGDWLRMIASLVFVLGLVLLAAYLFRRFAPRTITQGRSDAIRIVGTKMLGGRKSLMLVRVRGQTLLLGVTPQSIQCLTEIQELDGEWAQPADTSGGSEPVAFNQQLDRMIDSPHGSSRSSSEKKPI